MKECSLKNKNRGVFVISCIKEVYNTNYKGMINNLTIYILCEFELWRLLNKSLKLLTIAGKIYMGVTTNQILLAKNVHQELRSVERFEGLIEQSPWILRIRGLNSFRLSLVTRFNKESKLEKHRYTLFSSCNNVSKAHVLQ